MKKKSLPHILRIIVIILLGLFIKNNIVTAEAAINKTVIVGDYVWDVYATTNPNLTFKVNSPYLEFELNSKQTVGGYTYYSYWIFGLAGGKNAVIEVYDEVAQQNVDLIIVKVLSSEEDITLCEGQTGVFTAYSWQDMTANAYFGNEVGTIISQSKEEEMFNSRYKYLHSFEIEFPSQGNYTVYIIEGVSTQLKTYNVTVTDEHELVLDKEVKATCDSAGLTAGAHCSRCGKAVIEQQKISPLGHIWNRDEILQAETCIKEGSAVYICTRCGESKIETIPATNQHSWSDWETYVLPTCIDEGTEVSYCQNDSDHVRYRSVNSLGHDRDEGVITVKPTLDSEGIITYTCKRCGQKETEQIPKLELSGITIIPEELILKRGDSDKLFVTAEACDIENIPVEWTSSNETVATVDESGTITTLKVGRTDIIATLVDGGFTATCTLTVTAPDVTGIILDKESVSIYEGKTLQLSASVTPEDANHDVIWSSSDDSIATVDQNGLVTALKEGTATITASAEGGMTAVCNITVKKNVTFTDVADPSAWYFDSVYWAVENGITSGMGEGTFQPMAKLSRAQAVTFLYNLAGRPDVSGLEAKEFTDVSKSAWYYNAVKWAVANKITSGYGTGTFQPNATCNRAMIVTFLANYTKTAGSYKEPTTSASFKDVKATDWFGKSVDWAVENGITSGYGQGTFSPNVTCNRAMMVTFLKKVAVLPKV